MAKIKIWFEIYKIVESNIAVPGNDYYRPDALYTEKFTVLQKIPNLYKNKGSIPNYFETEEAAIQCLHDLTDIENYISNEHLTIIKKIEIVNERIYEDDED